MKLKMPDRTWRRRIIWALVALLALVVLVLAWLPDPVEVDAAPATRGPMQVTVDEDGMTRVTDRYVVAAPIGGQLERIELRAGARVEAGQPVATIVPGPSPLLDPRTRAQAEAQVATARAGVEQARAALAQAEEARDFARGELERMEMLVEQGVATGQQREQARFEAQTRATQHESARFALRSAEHQLEQARAALAQADAPAGGGQGGGPGQGFEVTSPVDARVLEVHQESGGPVAPGAPLLTVGDPDRLEVVVDVLTTAAVDIEPNQRAWIERWGGEPLRGHVRLVEPAAFTRVSSLGVEEQRVNVIIDVDEPTAQWRQIGDRFRVEASIVTWAHDDVLTVDSSAVFRQGQGWAVYTIVDGRARLTPVEVGRRTARQVQILDGLAEGQAVILYPGDTIDDGVRVRARDA